MTRNDAVKIKRFARQKVYAIDLFCGVGGLTHGLQKAGIDVRLGIDIDPACKFPFNANNKARFLLKSVNEISGNDIEAVYPKNGIRLLAGCAPCQTFSSYNRKARPSDERWWLLMQFSRLIKELSPELVTMENVPGLRKQKVFNKFVKKLKSAGYHVDYRVINCAQYGVPQHRPRLVLLASKLGPIDVLSAIELRVRTKTVRDAIAKLPPLNAGKIDKKDPLHRCASLSTLNLRRIKSSTPGGTWRDWNSKLVADCHKKETGKTYPSVYGRMTWDKPSPTITTQFFGFGNGRFGHPKQDRAISLREGAVLQSFPKNYRFVERDSPVHTRLVGRLIGNAVPVKLGEVIGKSIIKHVRELSASKPSSKRRKRNVPSAIK